MKRSSPCIAEYEVVNKFEYRKAGDTLIILCMPTDLTMPFLCLLNILPRLPRSVELYPTVTILRVFQCSNPAFQVVEQKSCMFTRRNHACSNRGTATHAFWGHLSSVWNVALALSLRKWTGTAWMAGWSQQVAIAFARSKRGMNGIRIGCKIT